MYCTAYFGVQIVSRKPHEEFFYYAGEHLNKPCFFPYLLFILTHQQHQIIISFPTHSWSRHVKTSRRVQSQNELDADDVAHIYCIQDMQCDHILHCSTSICRCCRYFKSAVVFFFAPIITLRRCNCWDTQPSGLFPICPIVSTDSRTDYPHRHKIQIQNAKFGDYHDIYCSILVHRYFPRMAGLHSSKYNRTLLV